MLVESRWCFHASKRGEGNQLVMSIISKEVRLLGRPQGEPTLDLFTIASVEVPDPGPGEVLVRNLYISVDPYMRGRMNDSKSYVPPFKLGEPMQGSAVGRVVKSNDSLIAEGALVSSFFGWREAFVAPAKLVQPFDPQGAPVAAFLGTLGMTGLTAWAGLFKIGALQSGETAFISGAAGAVGSVACQLAKLHGCKVIASAGSAEKIAFLKDELKVDYAFDYHDGEPLEHLLTAAPEGIHVYFDNTGGPQLEGALASIQNHGRIILCGAIAGYNKPMPGPRNLHSAIGKRLRLQGFIVSDFIGDLAEFHKETVPALLSGQLLNNETIVEGIDAAPAAFLSLLHSGDKHIGKLVVHVGD
jgi:NADPH-dependent curcumin reductase CurA